MLRVIFSNIFMVIRNIQSFSSNNSIFCNKTFSFFNFSQTNTSPTEKKKGLTLLEVVVVIAIVSTLAAIAIPQYQRYKDRALHTRLIAEMKMIEGDLLIFNAENDRFPEDLSELGLTNIMDPWGNPFQYLNIETAVGVGKVRKDHNLVPVNTDFDLYSMGPDGKSASPFTAKASQDDIVRANDGTYWGKVSDY